MSKHVPPSSTVPTQPAVFRTLNRRRFLLAGLMTAGTLTLPACSSDGSSLTEVFASSPQPDERLVNFYWALKDAAEVASNRQEKGFRAPAKVYERHAEAVAKELSRQCGRDNKGRAPENCPPLEPHQARSDAARLSSDAELRKAALQLITTGSTTVAGLVTNVYAMLAVVEDSAELEGAQRLDARTVAEGFAAGSGMKALTDAIDMTYGAIYVSGLALAADGGTNRETLRAVADRLRDFREAALGVVEAADAQTPVPQASYASPQGAPKDSDSALRSQLESTQPITSQLNYLVTQTESAESREFAARWCGLMARLEGAIKRAQGTDPLAR
ncbi:hypothetical protein CAURIC_06290 [Corynebacterium auriscanis]|nr:hypothetical protein CAURIC_06290 [Corynebacterium auriscanis]